MYITIVSDQLFAENPSYIWYDIHIKHRSLNLLIFVKISLSNSEAIMGMYIGYEIKLACVFDIVKTFH